MDKGGILLEWWHRKMKNMYYFCEYFINLEYFF